MTTRAKCPNPKGCDGELYARTDPPGEAWCPKCGYVFRRQDAPGNSRPEPKPSTRKP
ncbi:MAG TPA: hypothetical protein VKH46_00465 [Thermoanaerobaculia bacterium]|jgi:uncharacterized C2H2 Zn-finger protein|nr:hypothetical protein [Thermoanaerobaculia bacterium]